MTPEEYVKKWAKVTTSERATSQSHFNDLCRLLGHPMPHDADPHGEWFAFEKGVEKVGGETGDGWADVWKRGHFGWEYKGKHKDLDKAYDQLLRYRESLENPPILVVSDMHRFIVRTNFTNTVRASHEFTLDDFLDRPEESIGVLRKVFTNPEALRPDVTPEEITQAAAERFADLAQALRSRGFDPELVAHFLTRLIFCLFAEDSRLLPAGVLDRLTKAGRTDASRFTAGLADLFEKMATPGGGMFGADPIDWFNGALFRPGDDVVPMTEAEIEVLRDVARLDWSEIDPSIFGTLFERGLDPDKRSQLGAHYTHAEDIARIVVPVVIEPLRREYDAMKARVAEIIGTGKKGAALTRARNQASKIFEDFLDRLRAVRVMDPACGSGNFLYVALRSLKDLEREATLWGSEQFGKTQVARIGPEAVLGLELNPYAAELARVTIWIGQIQWMRRNGFGYERDPILRPLENVITGDAILDLADPGHPAEVEWPPADYVVGNPPFLGSRFLRDRLGDDYVEAMFAVYRGRVQHGADLAAYWFEKARAMIERGELKRAGLIATQGIRGGESRRVLERIKQTGDIFLAWSDREWMVEGAMVHISIVGFDDGTEPTRVLDDAPVAAINANLTSGLDMTTARRLKENLGTAFMGDTKGGAFDIAGDVAREMLPKPNPHRRPNSDVVRPWVNSTDITKRNRDQWIIDYPPGTTIEQAALYEAPFEYLREHVKEVREANRREAYARNWWMHVEPRPGMRAALSKFERYIVTPTVSKHRIFAWLPASVLPDHQLIVIARDDDYTFGVLHSHAHEAWARGMGTQLREVESGFRYTPTTTFETFPFPDPTEAQRDAIADAALRLVELRDEWLNPPGADEVELKKRTLTKLYNAMPGWLEQAHKRIDDAVLAAYGFPTGLSLEALLERLLVLNHERAPAA